jgi:hypothetical protein
MRSAIAVLLIITPALGTVAIAQDGGGHAPPNKNTPISIPLPTLPTMPVPTSGGSLTRLFQPSSELGSMMK